MPLLYSPHIPTSLHITPHLPTPCQPKLITYRLIIPLVQREMSVAMVNKNKARLEDVRGDLDQIRHWVATQVGGPGQQMLCNSQC